MDISKNKLFFLPIEFSPYKQKIFKNLYDDLELVETINGGKSAYERTFSPETNVGKKFLPNWANYYTTDKNFLKDSQLFYKNLKDISQNTDIVNSAYDSWNALLRFRFNFIFLLQLDILHKHF